MDHHKEQSESQLKDTSKQAATPLPQMSQAAEEEDPLEATQEEKLFHVLQPLHFFEPKNEQQPLHFPEPNNELTTKTDQDFIIEQNVSRFLPKRFVRYFAAPKSSVSSDLILTSQFLPKRFVRYFAAPKSSVSGDLTYNTITFRPVNEDVNDLYGASEHLTTPIPDISSVELYDDSATFQPQSNLPSDLTYNADPLNPKYEDVNDSSGASEHLTTPVPDVSSVELYDDSTTFQPIFCDVIEERQQEPVAKEEGETKRDAVSYAELDDCHSVPFQPIFCDVKEWQTKARRNKRGRDKGTDEGEEQIKKTRVYKRKRGKKTEDGEKQTKKATRGKRKKGEKTAVKRENQTKEASGWKRPKDKRTQRVEDMPRCEECGKVFTQKRNLIRHRSLHNQEKPYLCQECGKKFAKSYYLKNHLLTHSNTKNHHCADCGSSFTTKSDLNKHARIHSLNRDYECHICYMTFYRKDILNQHLLSHNSQQVHVCEECGKQFTLEKYLTLHMLVHTRMKHYTCETCSREFSRKSDLNRHKRIHQEDKRFTCDICGRKFRAKYTLKNHIRTHLYGTKDLECGAKDLECGTKDLECEVCDMRFDKANTLKVHKAKIHFI
ncbi:zinc finger protein 716-like [Eriocheir sinensis]|uniref:zinc finger protein 716-like n=1 Tax=Eriocheir sinensis TaxID=95602 RepID=UPI0021C56768|nr:zinc finger protein 716-like [Eriocheir sinensis]XP_050733060.1 zinc finger protein 716-like [Eriocheir sinensis]XP_050733061.1 zinc finger protein 716-like [Eriocheir sinensis]XP_050733062.1 zinc finger protein 716-like [Eriocheir sinensis]XP_050733063.1 zinc finger protein 716-like [Eriocheir sinensis]XP_050733064.1 zinc finger protein 716-like [Eriocheir sinensis]